MSEKDFKTSLAKLISRWLLFNDLVMILYGSMLGYMYRGSPGGILEGLAYAAALAVLEMAGWVPIAGPYIFWCHIIPWLKSCVPVANEPLFAVVDIVLMVNTVVINVFANTLTILLIISLVLAITGD